MKIELRDGECGAVLVLSGRFDTAACGELEQQIQSVQEQSPCVCLDLAAVEYVSSAFLRVCLKYSKSLGQDSFCLNNPRPEVRKVFKISNLEKMIK